MAEEKNKKLTPTRLQPGPAGAQPGQLPHEKIAQILAQGRLLTMEKDLERLREKQEEGKAGVSPELKKKLELLRKQSEKAPGFTASIWTR